jgi:hypothetical protein
MRILAQLADVVNTVACRSPRAKTSGTDVHCIGAMVYGRYATLQILCGSKQLKLGGG